MAQDKSIAVVNKERMQTLNAYLTKSMPAIKAVLPKHMTAERMMRIVAASASRQPELLECTPLSIAQAVVMSSQLGLEPVGPLGHAYLVPYKNKKNNYRKEVQLIIGYKGMIDLARRSGNVAMIEAHAIYERDAYDVRYGLESKLEHRPYLGKESRGDIVLVYAIATFRDGMKQPEVMTIGEVEDIRSRSMAANNGPWVTDFTEMARKTVVKRLCKYLPLSVEMANAISIDNAAESGENQIEAIDIDLPDELRPVDVEANEIPQINKADEIARDLGAKRSAAAAEKTAELVPPVDFDPAQSMLLDLLGPAGLDLKPTEQAAYVKKHTGKQIGDLSAMEIQKLIGQINTELKARDDAGAADLF